MHVKLLAGMVGRGPAGAPRQGSQRRQAPCPFRGVLAPGKETAMGKQVGILVFSDLLVCALAAPLIAQPAQAGFGFNAPDIRGFPTGAVRLTGGRV